MTPALPQPTTRLTLLMVMMPSGLEEEDTCRVRMRVWMRGTLVRLPVPPQLLGTDGESHHMCHPAALIKIDVYDVEVGQPASAQAVAVAYCQEADSRAGGAEACGSPSPAPFVAVEI